MPNTRLGIYERRLLIAPRIDVNNILDLAWYLYSTDDRKSKTQTVGYMSGFHRGMLEAQSRGATITEKDVVQYVHRMVSLFESAVSGESKRKVLDAACLKVQTLEIKAPEATRVGGNGCKPRGNDPEFNKAFADLYYPLRILRVRNGRFNGVHSDERDWWMSVALHNFPERTADRPEVELDAECLEWLRNSPENYRKVLSKLSERRGYWAPVLGSPELTGELGENNAKIAADDLRNYSEERARKGKPIILSLYAKLLYGVSHDPPA